MDTENSSENLEELIELSDPDFEDWVYNRTPTKSQNKKTPPNTHTQAQELTPTKSQNKKTPPNTHTQAQEPTAPPNTPPTPKYKPPHPLAQHQPNSTNLSHSTNKRKTTNANSPSSPNTYPIEPHPLASPSMHNPGSNCHQNSKRHGTSVSEIACHISPQSSTNITLRS